LVFLEITNQTKKPIQKTTALILILPKKTAPHKEYFLFAQKKSLRIA